MGNRERNANYFYDLLNVSRTATESEIKSAYRKLVIQCHPDRNEGNEELTERFKEISIAYAVLVDPNRRRQYDLLGPSAPPQLFEGFEVSQLGGVGRLLGALCTQLGVPLQTEVEPSVLALAQEIVRDQACNVVVQQLCFDSLSSGKMEPQKAAFYWMSLSESDIQNGVLVSCRSKSMSKFKLLLFDREGHVRLIRDSAKHKKYTSAEIFFLSHSLMHKSHVLCMRSVMEMDKEMPFELGLLDNFEPDVQIRLVPGRHLVCVYGDNWFQHIKYEMRLLLANCEAPFLKEIQRLESTLNARKKVLSEAKSEYVEAKRRYDAIVEKIGSTGNEVVELLKSRELAYEQFIQSSAAPFTSSERLQKSVKSESDETDNTKFTSFVSFIGNAFTRRQSN